MKDKTPLYYRLRDTPITTNWNQSLYIYKYIHLEYFLNMLITKEFYVGQKCSFSDSAESNLSELNNPHFSAANVQVNEKEQEQTHNAVLCFRNLYREYSAIPASCWTWQQTENYMMWLAYTARFGVRIKTNIEKLLSSLELSEYQVVCDKMVYKRFYSTTECIEDAMFHKRDYFKDEREFRFYFIPQSKKTILYLNNNSHLKIQIRNPVSMIDEIVISPFIQHSILLKDMLVEKFGFDKKQIKHSQIKLSSL